jgi:hypothetical protein
VKIRRKYLAVTKIPVLDEKAIPKDPYGLLLDPHTGIPLPDAATATSAHATLKYILEASRELRPHYMICFDQSVDRRHKLSTEKQREKKREFLREQGLHSFYYLSHAPFLFMASNERTLRTVRDRLIECGVPEAIDAKTGKFRLQPIRPI